VDELVAWLVGAEARPLRADQLLEAVAERLQSIAGVWRLSTGLRTMHPEVAVVSIWWTADGGLRTEDVLHEQVPSAVGRGPIPLLAASGEDHLRIRLDGARSELPLLATLQDQGATDYVLLHLPGARDHALSLATRAPGGFTDEQLAAFEALRLPLSLRLDLSLQKHVTWSLLRSYLGNDAARHVLHGKYRRLDGERRRVVVFTADLRGFTHRVDHRDLDEVLADLDRYFECVSDPWMDAGGEVLKFVGDAVLGVMPLGDDAGERASVAQRALAAARQAFEGLQEVSDALPEGRLPLTMGFVLHAGEVAYGNIGSRRRVDFTVIGSCVNEAARMEKLTKELAPLVLSEAFVAELGTVEGLRDLGAHGLRGVTEPVRMYTPAT